jgi:hypothetical protein
MGPSLNKEKSSCLDYDNGSCAASGPSPSKENEHNVDEVESVYISKWLGLFKSEDENNCCQLVVDAQAFQVFNYRQMLMASLVAVRIHVLYLKFGSIMDKLGP